MLIPALKIVYKQRNHCLGKVSWAEKSLDGQGFLAEKPIAGKGILGRTIFGQEFFSGQINICLGKIFWTRWKSTNLEKYSQLVVLGQIV